MTHDEKVELVQAFLGNDSGATDSLVSAYLTKAKSDVLRRLYPYGIPEDVNDVPERYEMVQVSLARNYYLRQGAEGELHHYENGFNRSYKSTNDEELLSEVIPYVKLV